MQETALASCRWPRVASMKKVWVEALHMFVALGQPTSYLRAIVPHIEHGDDWT